MGEEFKVHWCDDNILHIEHDGEVEEISKEEALEKYGSNEKFMEVYSKLTNKNNILEELIKSQKDIENIPINHDEPMPIEGNDDHIQPNDDKISSDRDYIIPDKEIINDGGTINNDVPINQDKDMPIESIGDHIQPKEAENPQGSEYIIPDKEIINDGGTLDIDTPQSNDKTLPIEKQDYNLTPKNVIQWAKNGEITLETEQNINEKINNSEDMPIEEAKETGTSKDDIIKKDLDIDPMIIYYGCIEKIARNYIETNKMDISIIPKKVLDAVIKQYKEKGIITTNIDEVQFFIKQVNDRIKELENSNDNKMNM